MTAAPEGQDGDGPPATRARGVADIIKAVENSVSASTDAERIRQTTAAHIEQLREAAREAGVMPGEPMMPLVDALARSLAWMGELSAENARMAAQIPAVLLDARRTADAEVERQRAAMAADQAGFVRQVAGEVGEAVKANEARRFAIFRRNSLLGIAGGLAAGALVVGSGSYLFGRYDRMAAVRAAEADVRDAFRASPASAEAWARLMRANDPGQFLATCQGTAVKVIDGRRACSPPLWLDPPRPALPGAPR